MLLVFPELQLRPMRQIRCVEGMRTIPRNQHHRQSNVGNKQGENGRIPVCISFPFVYVKMGYPGAPSEHSATMHVRHGVRKAKGKRPGPREGGGKAREIHPFTEGEERKRKLTSKSSSEEEEPEDEP